MLLDAVADTEHVGGDHRDLAARLDHPGAADQLFADRGRQQIELVFRRQRRLATRRGGCDRGGVVDQEGGDAAVEEAVLLQELRPALHGDGAGAARQFGELGADQVHESLPADIGVDALGNGRKFRISVGPHAVSPYCLLMRSNGLSARLAQAISVSASMRGSVRSRPDR